MKNLALVFAALCLGVFVGVYFTKGPVEKKWAESGIEKIEKLPREDQLKAAEEYYGKAVVLFLASLGQRTLKDQAKLAEPIIKVIDPKNLPPQDAITDAESNAVAQITLAKNEVTTYPVESKKDDSKTGDKNLDRLVAYKKSSLFDKMTPQVETMMGAFGGTLKRSQERTDQIYMRLNFFIQEDKLHGEIAIEMIDPEGRSYSRSKGDGANNTLRAVPGKKDQVYLEPAPGDFILLDLSNPNVLSGSYYSNGGEFVGPVMLWRKQ